MHSLAICLGATTWTLLFKTEEKAAEIYNNYVEFKAKGDISGPLIAADDFGQAFAIDIDAIKGIMLDDMDQSMLAQVERGLHQARAQGKAQVRAMADPVIKESLRAQQMGPAVMSPMAGGRFNG